MIKEYNILHRVCMHTVIKLQYYTTIITTAMGDNLSYVSTFVSLSAFNVSYLFYLLQTYLIPLLDK